MFLFGKARGASFESLSGPKSFTIYEPRNILGYDFSLRCTLSICIEYFQFLLFLRKVIYRF